MKSPQAGQCGSETGRLAHVLPQMQPRQSHIATAPVPAESVSS